MRFDVITLFPEMFTAPLSVGVVGQAVKNGKFHVHYHNPRTYTQDAHKTVDDRPYGGGDGMVMLAEPLEQALRAALNASFDSANGGRADAPDSGRAPADVPAGRGRRRVIYLSPHGQLLTDRVARELADFDQLVLICGRYGGVDQRLLSQQVDQELSIGDYVLSGGELAALVVIDTVARFLPGVLGNALSSENESFSNGLLESPQFTRPREYGGLAVPPVLLSGDHERITRWRYLVSLLRTRQDRPDLLKRLRIIDEDWTEAEKLVQEMTPAERLAIGLKDGHERV